MIVSTSNDISRISELPLTPRTVSCPVDRSESCLMEHIDCVSFIPHLKEHQSFVPKTRRFHVLEQIRLDCFSEHPLIELYIMVAIHLA